jgi:hypothetical protein
MGTHRASNLREHLRRLEEFIREQERRPSNLPNGRKQKRSVNRSLYGVRSGTTSYRRQSVAERTLKESEMTPEQQQELLANSTAQVDREEQLKRVSRNSYPIPTDKGIYLK